MFPPPKKKTKTEARPISPTAPHPPSILVEPSWNPPWNRPVDPPKPSRNTPRTTPEASRSFCRTLAEFSRNPRGTVRNLASEPPQTTPEPIWALLEKNSRSLTNKLLWRDIWAYGKIGFPFVFSLSQPQICNNVAEVKLSVLGVLTQSKSTPLWNRRGCFTVKAAFWAKPAARYDLWIGLVVWSSPGPGLRPIALQGPDWHRRAQSCPVGYTEPASPSFALYSKTVQSKAERCQLGTADRARPRPDGEIEARSRPDGAIEAWPNAVGSRPGPDRGQAGKQALTRAWRCERAPIRVGDSKPPIQATRSSPPVLLRMQPKIV